VEKSFANRMIAGNGKQQKEDTKAIPYDSPQGLAYFKTTA
jgi:hypothetical protein